MCKPHSQSGRSSQDEPEQLAPADLLQAQGMTQERGGVFLMFTFQMSPKQPIMSGPGHVWRYGRGFCVEGKTLEQKDKFSFLLG